LCIYYQEDHVLKCLLGDLACSCVRPDQSSATVRLHYLKDGNVNFAFKINRAEYFVPVVLVFRALQEVGSSEMHHRSFAHH
jgi:DNA-directed RNA polymerase I subunit RPA2